MPTTTNGAPYPASTAPNNVPGDIKALAEWVDADVLQALTALIAQHATPAGATMAWDDTVPPAGWHVRDGRAISRADNPVLFARFGTRHGAGNGSTTFNLPNDRGRTLVGLDPDQTEFNAIGKTGGAKTHTLSVNEMPRHKHGGQTGTEDAQHTHGSGISNTTGFGAAGAGGNYSLPSTAGTNGLPTGPQSASHRHPINDEGGGQPHNNLQPYTVTNWIIKAG